MQLRSFENNDFDRGAPFLKEALWILLGAPLLASFVLPCSSLKVSILRLFGARIAGGVCIKPGVKVKFPWKLSVGEDSWIGEGVWIDNLDHVVVGANCCISQGAYLCTGDHSWNLSSFDLKTKAIHIEDKVWLAAFSRVSPGVQCGEGAVLTFGSVATSSLEKWSIYQGHPAQKIKDRSQDSQ